MGYPRILVTGGAGFIGSHLVERLLRDGHQVTIIDDLSTGTVENIDPLLANPNLTFVVDTILNRTLMEQLVQQNDAVFHLASAVGVKRIMDQKVATVETIVEGSEITLKFCARYHRRVLITSTSEVYGKSLHLPFREEGDLTLGPSSHHRWAYACAKLLDEFLALAHYKESRLPATVVRLFNTVGPRQTDQYGMVIPTFVRQALRGIPLTVHGDGTQSRCFCHVLDVVEALVKALNTPASLGEVINLGNPEPITIKALAERVLQHTASDADIKFIPYSDAYGQGFEDMKAREPDITKAQELLGFTVGHTLDDILKELVTIEREKLEAVQSSFPSP